MGEVPAQTFSPDGKQNDAYAGSVTTMNPKKLRAKEHLGGPMNQEEIKMNRVMLNEINQLKKKLGDRY